MNLSVAQPVEGLQQSRDSRVRTLLRVAFLLIFIAYIVQIATPLRLINDGIDYLMQASSAADGHGFRVNGVQSMRPPGYPLLIVLLIKGGIGRSWALVALNCICLAIGAWAASLLLQASLGLSRYLSQFLTLLTLLSFVIIRNVTYPLSDVCFFGTSLLCVLALLRLENAQGSRRFWGCVALVPLIGLCIELRTIGICLIPALLWAAMGGIEGAKKLWPIIMRYRIAILVVAIAVVVLIGWVFLQSRYMKFNLPTFQHRGIMRSMIANLRDHTLEWGELTVNAPSSKLPALLSLPIRIIGLLAILAAAAGIWRKRTQPDSPLLYLLGSAAIVFAYPWFDTRLWLPVLPLLMGYVLLGIRSIVPSKWLRGASLAYCSIYCLLGLLALAYTTRITFAGPRFPELYGDGNLRATYRLAFRGEQPKHPGDINAEALYLLWRFEPRASSGADAPGGIAPTVN